MSNSQRKWVSIIVGGLFGFGMSQVLILITTSAYSQSQGAFVFTIVGLFVISTFFGSILAGVLDRDEADIRGIQAALIALAIYLMFDLVVLLFFSFNRLLVTIDMYIFFWVWIPILLLGVVGGKIGGSLRLKYRKLK